MGQALDPSVRTLTRQSPFSYTCRQCSRCCYGKHIRLNPYELIRLAEALGCSTGEVIARYTEDGIALAVRDVPGTPCVFLGEHGCRVHSGRPAACRLYPLGRILDSQGNESFCEVTPHPRSEGIYSTEGTVADYLAAQEVEPYFEAAEEYYQLFCRVRVLLQRSEEHSEESGADVSALDLLDADAQIRAHGWAVPTDSRERARLHIAALTAWLDRLDAE